MMQLLQANWWALVIALLIGVAVAWRVFAANRRARVEIKAFDALEEGAGPAKRNQALIDAPARPDAAPAAAPAAPAPASGDDLTRIKGLGPKLAALLHSLGVTEFAQIAAWNDADIDRIDAQLGNFSGRIRRDNWVEQAKYLGAGDMAGFEEQFGRL